MLIETWLPIAEVGVESMRERGASSALPPLYFLHVWWARRPLIASRAALLASILPAWSTDWPPALNTKFPTQESYHAWFTALIGIRGDPVQGMNLVQWAKAKGIKLSVHPYGGAPRAFTVNPSADDLHTMADLLELAWGTRQVSLLDPFAGGGSIPFEALRYGLTTWANDLNPVAATILKATLDYPARFGPSLADDIRRWGKRWADLVKEQLTPYFPKQGKENIFAYLWARTVQWHGRTVPLSPNWWLSSSGSLAAVRVVADPDATTPRFEILTGKQLAGYDPDQGTVSRGTGRCPWTGETIDGEYIKAEAQAGRMGQVLYAVAVKRQGGFDFRAPTEEDTAAFAAAGEELARRLPGWLAEDVVPHEAFPGGNDNRPLTYGMPLWRDFFSPRQLLSMGVFMETLRTLEPEIRAALLPDRAEAVLTYLGFVIDKAADYNARLCAWHPSRSVIAHVFARHDFALVWSHPEFDASANLMPWVVEQVADAYNGLAEVAAPAQSLLFQAGLPPAVERLSILRGSAASLPSLPDGSIHSITVDPPYYNNVQYAELADFFYVWLKRSVGPIFPQFFTDELTNKDDETVANPARFASLGKKKEELAEQDYENKMAAAFREMYRVLRADGTLTVMFTHKQVAAWDTLASALIGAGFTIQASWPVHTESAHSLHQAKKNAAASTILLACRKRGQAAAEPTWWEDLQPEVRRVARAKAAEYAAMGIRGADLYISVFGPTLSVISQRWPVLTSEVDPKTGQPKLLRPEVALDLAREEVISLRKQGLLEGRDVQFDGVTDWYLMAWDAYAAEQFPYDEARKLAIALGIDLDRDLMASNRLAVKKGENILMQTPTARRRKGMVDDEMMLFTHWIDAAHTAMMVYSEDGAGACDLFLQRTGLKNNATFKALLQSLINAIPRSRIKGKFVRPEAEVLENMRLAFYADSLTAPVEVEPKLPMEQQLGLGFAEDEAEDGEEEEE
jgi:adenine-specific DNA methylase